MISYQLDVITQVYEHGRLQTKREKWAGRKSCLLWALMLLEMQGEGHTEEVPALIIGPEWKDGVHAVF